MSQEATIISAGLEDTRALGADLAARLAPGSVLALDGPLGAGKTHLAQGLAAALGHDGPVTSPTFTLVHEYTGGRLPLFHLDFYRLDTAEEVTALGWEEYLELGGIVIVEWAGKFPELLPPATTTWVRIDLPEPGSAEDLANPDLRRITVRTPAG
jgi:tRNA threonylcarbamoyladenosine biosynthesis protein TsaE